MTRCLLLSIRFLDDCYHGLTDQGEKPEWPPSPFRVFQALVAGNARGSQLPDSIRDALRWLESLDPPVITAPPSRGGRMLLTYVLNNTSDSDPASRTPKIIRPTLLNGDRLVQYSWVFDDGVAGASECADLIASAAKHIRCLGWGIDLAIGTGEIVGVLPNPTIERAQYRPDAGISASGVDFRVPRVDSLMSLERAHADFLGRYKESGITRLESASAVFDLHRYVVGSARPNVSFRLVNSDGDAVAIRHQLIKPLVGMVRNLANLPNVTAALGRETVDTQFLGHPKEGAGEHLAILPLPTIREGPTDGRIRRVMLAEPFESDGKLCRNLGILLDGEELISRTHEYRFPQIFLERVADRDKLLHFYVGVSRIWASVTPVLLPGYDDRKEHRGNHQKRIARAKQLVFKAMRQAGVNVNAEIELSRVPYWTGTLHTTDYDPREKLRHYPRWHIRLVFDRPVTGPLVIGAGRYCGFGLMARVEF